MADVPRVNRFSQLYQLIQIVGDPCFLISLYYDEDCRQQTIIRDLYLVWLLD
jgi:hypothetical protein